MGGVCVWGAGAFPREMGDLGGRGGVSQNMTGANFLAHHLIGIIFERFPITDVICNRFD